jgi:glycosyltransferase involved in cell wall biosynthesis
MQPDPTVSPPVICFPFVGDLVGGSHISAIGLIRKIDRRRYRPLVLLQHQEGDLADFFRREGIATEQAPQSADLFHGQRLRGRELLRILRDVRSLAGFLRARDVRIVHSNDGRTHATWGLAARLARAKLVWHHRSDPNAFGLRFVAPWIADRVVAVSHFASPHPGLISAARRCQVIHSPFAMPADIDRKQVRAELVKELGCSPETRIIGFFGALIPRKRPLLFVDAIAALRRQAPELPVIGLLFGEPLENADAEVRERALAAGIADDIRLMGFRYPGERWLSACDLLMVPAVDEPFGRTLIEAMMLGTPVVATASGGNIEAIEQGVTGLLVPPEDAEALAQGCHAMLTDPAMAGIAATARDEARRVYRAEAHAEAVMQIYDELLAHDAPRPSAGGHPIRKVIRLLS